MCKVNKKDSSFYKSKYKKNGLYSYCKQCHLDRYMNNPACRKRYTTYRSVLSNRWLNILHRYKFKGYENVKVLMTKEQFLAKMDNEVYKTMFDTWKAADFNQKLSPTVDRIDPKGHYSIDNIRWLTLSDNARRAAKNGHRAKPIAQYTKSGLFVQNFRSATEAAKQLVGKDCAVANIRMCAMGKIPSAYGYVWRERT